MNNNPYGMPAANRYVIHHNKYNVEKGIRKSNRRLIGPSVENYNANGSRGGKAAAYVLGAGVIIPYMIITRAIDATTRLIAELTKSDEFYNKIMIARSDYSSCLRRICKRKTKADSFTNYIEILKKINNLNPNITSLINNISTISKENKSSIQNRIQKYNEREKANKEIGRTSRTIISKNESRRKIPSYTQLVRNFRTNLVYAREVNDNRENKFLQNVQLVKSYVPKSVLANGNNVNQLFKRLNIYNRISASNGSWTSYSNRDKLLLSKIIELQDYAFLNYIKSEGARITREGIIDFYKNSFALYFIVCAKDYSPIQMRAMIIQRLKSIENRFESAAAILKPKQNVTTRTGNNTRPKTPNGMTRTGNNLVNHLRTPTKPPRGRLPPLNRTQ
jgi:hypothetical protein